MGKERIIDVNDSDTEPTNEDIEGGEALEDGKDDDVEGKEESFIPGEGRVVEEEEKETPFESCEDLVASVRVAIGIIDERRGEEAEIVNNDIKEIFQEYGISVPEDRILNTALGEALE